MLRVAVASEVVNVVVLAAAVVKEVARNGTASRGGFSWREIELASGRGVARQPLARGEESKETGPREVREGCQEGVSLGVRQIEKVWEGLGGVTMWRQGY